MPEVIIKAEDVSKVFRLGALGTGTLRQDLKLWWNTNVLNKKDKFFKQQDELSKDYLWALKNVSFEIEEGDVYGIVGRNGAGKSTLLKILSRIIRPTEGSIKGKGKISSLLEVGTGFHGDLTGRENIYISGYMLGMKKHEIKRKFDEIIDFSGVEKFVDTPVKRYSSGMYVRLAFAVAAHLDPDILIVDEVLAVGDIEFQKKCLGKMKDVSQEKGRTIIFVSHNMQAINSICEKAIWMQKGSVLANGEAQEVVNSYLSTYQQKLWQQQWYLNEAPGNNLIKVLSVELLPEFINSSDVIDIRTPLNVSFRFYNLTDNINLICSIRLFTLSDECVFEISTTPFSCNKGTYEGSCVIPGNFLNDGSYYLSVNFTNESFESLFYFSECLNFDVEDYREDINYFGKWLGYVRPKFSFAIKSVE